MEPKATSISAADTQAAVQALQTVPPSENGAATPAGASPGDKTPAGSYTFPAAAPRPQRWRIWAGSGLGVLVVAILLVWLLNKGDSKTHGGGNPTRAATVKTIKPRNKDLVRNLTLPVSIKAMSQVELYAKTSGYLKSIQRQWKPDSVAAALSAGLHKSGAYVLNPAAWATKLTRCIFNDLARYAEKDIGSRVTAGECLLEIDAPEQHQEIVEKESVLLQRLADLEAARTAIASFEAAVEAAKAQTELARKDIVKYQEDYTFHTKQLARYESLVRDGTIMSDILDIKEFQAKSAKAAWESGKAKLKVVEADANVLDRKLDTARVDLKVKESLVRIARDGVERARILAGFAQVCAPFQGVITYRGVDIGDYVSAHTRHLMTVCDLDTIKLVAHVPERDAPWVTDKTEAYLHDIDALEGWEKRDIKVARIAHSLDAKSRTMQVEIDLDNKEHKLFPGMYGQVTLQLQKIENTYAIPATAVYSRKNVNHIIIVKDGVARLQPVHILFDDGKEVQVRKIMGSREVPLDGTEDVVVSNKGEIADGQHVTAVR